MFLGAASSVFALGGLLGALLASQILQWTGPKKTVFVTSLLYIAGGLVKAVAQDVTLLVLGRLLSGVAAGAVTVVVPLFINDLAPPGSKGRLGATTQVTINVGILLTQILGALCNGESTWRIVMLVGAALGAVQAVMLIGVTESPQTLYKNGDKELARKTLARLRGTAEIEEEFDTFGSSETGNANSFVEQTSENDPLLEETPAKNTETGLFDFVTKREHRASFALVVMIMIVQQFTGINAVVMYGVAILSNMLPQYAGGLNAGISAINLIITISASMLFDIVSHRSLLLTSIGGMAFFSLALACGLYFHFSALSAIGIFFFVGFFSIGLGPLPWMVASNNVHRNSLGSAQSIALVANWIGTGAISFAVPVMASIVGMDMVFFIFSGLGGLSLLWGYFFIPSN
ncbi:MFS general substrate transporter [Morchella conica CCBAS932]|uniref:MFS general substrate transporter n=1 Tax=Morchella conica CCBAS932 TaxID=1392247 RepID=A0A3N4KNM9_9PEZI|nr:MFS general substrate transporter [Morchella conica CCBAS932]